MADIATSTPLIFDFDGSILMPTIRSRLPARRTIEEIHYWNKGVALFKKKLSATIHPDDRDAVWVASSMLAVISFASFEAATPEETWPLNPSLNAGPEWHKIGQGKSTLWRFVKPDRPDSLFSTVLAAMPIAELSLENVPAVFLKLYDLDVLPPDRSPYAIPLTSLFAPQNVHCPSSAIALFYMANNWMNTAFGRLVLNKDPRALLLMVYWYSKILRGPWWLRVRALVEGRATCMFLERNCPHNVTIQNLLEVPRHHLLKNDS